MIFSNQFNGKEPQIIGLFIEVFTASEGQDEGAHIGNLVNKLLNDTARKDIHVFIAEDNGKPIGAAIFTRLTYINDGRTVFILSPMAVATDKQGQKVGQALLTHALIELRKTGVDVAMTYGDPNFYSKIGFLPVNQTVIPSPLPLSQPHGWIGQSLSSAPLTPMKGPAICVTALNDGTLW